MMVNPKLGRETCSACKGTGHLSTSTPHSPFVHCTQGWELPLQKFIRCPHCAGMGYRLMPLSPIRIKHTAAPR